MDIWILCHIEDLKPGARVQLIQLSETKTAAPGDLLVDGTSFGDLERMIEFKLQEAQGREP